MEKYEISIIDCKAYFADEYLQEAQKNGFELCGTITTREVSGKLMVSFAVRKPILPPIMRYVLICTNNSYKAPVTRKLEFEKLEQAIAAYNEYKENSEDVREHADIFDLKEGIYVDIQNI